MLNFSVLAAVSIICFPSDNSRRLTYASQLPTDDPGSSPRPFIACHVKSSHVIAMLCYDML